MRRNLGLVFPEGILIGKKSIRSKDRERQTRSYSLRLLLTALVAIFSLGLLLTRLFELTVIKGGYYRGLASGNRIREKKITAPRGIIYDRKGIALVHNVPLGANIVTREYPYGETLAHVLGYIGEIDGMELKIQNEKLSSGRWYKMGDFIGKGGVEKYYESEIRGIDGKELYEVDADGKSVRNLGKVDPVAGKNINLSLIHI